MEVMKRTDYIKSALLGSLILLFMDLESVAQNPGVWTESFINSGSTFLPLADYGWQVNYKRDATPINPGETNWSLSFAVTGFSMAASAARERFLGQPLLLWTDRVGGILNADNTTGVEFTFQNETLSAEQPTGPWHEWSLSLKIAGNWYVSEETYFSAYTAPFTVFINPHNSRWQDLHFVSGSTLMRGLDIPVLPEGSLDAVGLYSDEFIGGRVRILEISVHGDVSAATNQSDGFLFSLRSAINPVLGIKSGLFDHSEARTFGLTPLEAEKVAVFPVEEKDEYRYQLGATLSAFQGELYMVWVQNILRESTPDARIVYSRSPDGVSWSAPQVLFTLEMLTTEDRILDSTGMWVADGILHAYVALSHKEVYVKTSSDGSEWSEPVKWIDKMGGIAEPPRKTESGWVWLGQNISEGRALKFLYHDNDSFHDFSGWKNAEVTGELPVAGWREPATFIRPDGTLIATIRGHGQADGGRGILYAAESRDGGRRWRSTATDFPDANSRVSAGMLPDGTVYLINNPGPPGNRSILSIALSDDGKIFDRAYALGYDVPPIRWPAYGKPASLKGYQYPHSVIWKEHLIVACALNKEDIYIFRIPLETLMH